MNGLRSALGRRLVRSYPQAWRGRYEDEVLALLDDTKVRWRDVADLARGLLVERVRSVFEPGDHPYATFAALEVFGFVFVLVMMVGAVSLGWAARAWLGPISWWWGLIAGIATAAIFLVHFITVARAARHPGAATSDGPPLRGVILCLAALLACLWTFEWAKFGGNTSAVVVALLTPYLRGVLEKRGTWRRMNMAIGQLIQYRHDIKWARLELERCEHLAAAGMSAPIEEARANLDRIEKSGEEIFTSLHALGYRARFRQDA